MGRRTVSVRECILAAVFLAICGLFGASQRISSHSWRKSQEFDVAWQFPSEYEHSGIGVTSTGQIVSFEALASSLNSDKPVIMATVSWEDVDLAMNWLCSVKRLGVTNYMLYATDVRTYEYFASIREPVYLDDGARQEYDEVSGDYKSRGYKRLTLRRASCIKKALSMGIDVLMVSVSAVWLGNPLPLIPTGPDIAAPLENGTPTPEFMLIRANAGSLGMWSGFVNDLGRRMIELDYSMGPRMQRDLIHFHIEASGVKFHPLSPTLFPDGTDYFSSSPSPSSPGSPAVVRNHHITGHNLKKLLLESHQLWYVSGVVVEEGVSSVATAAAMVCVEASAETGTRAVESEPTGTDTQPPPPLPAPELGRALDRLIADRKDPTTNTLIVATVNWGFLDFGLNWLCSVRRLGLRNYVFYATDERVYEWLVAAGESVYREAETEDEKEIAVNYGTVAYQQLVLARARFIMKVLDLGCNVLTVDVDAVWLQNPLSLLGGSSADIEAQVEQNGDPCAGFMLIKASERNRGMWAGLLADLTKRVDASVKAGKLLFENQQKIVFEHIKQSGVTLHGLPASLFPHGRAYFNPSYQGSPAVVHNNYVTGHEVKLKRFQSKGLWWVEWVPREGGGGGGGGGGELTPSGGGETDMGMTCDGVMVGSREWHEAPGSRPVTPGAVVVPSRDLGDGDPTPAAAAASGEPEVTAPGEAAAPAAVAALTDAGTDTPPLPPPAPELGRALDRLIADRKDPTTNTLIVATVNWGFLDFGLNWLCSVRRLGLRNYVFYATDERVYEWLVAAGEPVYRAEQTKQEKEAAVNYGTVAYQRLVLARAYFILAVLKHDVHVLTVDVDAVWLKNPLPLLGQSSSDVEAQLEANNSPCAGFMLVKASERNREMWTGCLADLTKRVDASIKAGKLLFTNQQMIIHSHMKKYGTSIHGLPTDLFPNGQKYFRASYNGSPAVVHNNYVIGHDVKKKRFVKKNLWWTNGNDLTCTNDVQPS